MSLRKRERQLISEGKSLVSDSRLDDRTIAKFTAKVEHLSEDLGSEDRASLNTLTDKFLIVASDQRGLLVEKIVVALENVLAEADAKAKDSDDGDQATKATSETPKADEAPKPADDKDKSEDEDADFEQDPLGSVLQAIRHSLAPKPKVSKVDKLKATAKKGATVAKDTATKVYSDVADKTKNAYKKYAPEAKEVAVKNAHLFAETAKEFSKKFKETNFDHKDDGSSKD